MVGRFKGRAKGAQNVGKSARFRDYGSEKHGKRREESRDDYRAPRAHKAPINANLAANAFTSTAAASTTMSCLNPR